MSHLDKCLAADATGYKKGGIETRPVRIWSFQYEPRVDSGVHSQQEEIW